MTYWALFMILLSAMMEMIVIAAGIVFCRLEKINAWETLQAIQKR